MLKWIIAACVAAGLAVSGPARAQEKLLIRVTRQPSIIYMPTYVMESKHLIEVHAAKLGVPGLKVEWVNVNGGGTATDALLSNSVDVVNTGVGNMLLLWDRTRGGVKAIVATSALPLTLITRDPEIKTLRDYKPGDKIALPTVRVSTQAILLQIACEQVFGPEQGSKLDANTVQLGHPDAVGAMLDPRGQITSHFSAPPFSIEELRRVPGAHVVTDSQAIMGSPLTVANLFTTTRFADANPKIVEAIKDAAVEALKFIHTNTPEAVAIYRAGSNDPTSDQDLLAMLKQPGMMEFNPQPQGSMRFATHMHKAGLLKTQPTAWTDYFLPVAKGLDGS